MKLLKKVFVLMILIMVVSSCSLQTLAATVTIVTDEKEIEELMKNYSTEKNTYNNTYRTTSKLIEKENNIENPDFGTTFDETVGINGFIDDPIDILSVAGTVREYHNFSWTMDKLNENKFNPSYVSVWNFDEYYKKLYEAGIEVMPCIQGTSKCIVSNMSSRNQKPIDTGADSCNPESYANHASTMFQYAARYGTKTVDDSRLLLASDQEKLSGLGYIKYYENWNEPDKTWEGEKSYFSPYELAAMCSADYDGHEGRLGNNYGIKNADPDAKLVMGGVANSKELTRYLDSMKIWAENNRTDKQLPLDVINFHMYVGTNCPENSEFEQRCKEIVSWRNQNAIDKEVWLTEFGWDTNPNSQLTATSKEKQRDWLVRSYLIANAAGIERSTMYMIRDTSNENETGKYATSGLTTQKGEWNEKPSWYGVYTLKNTLKGFKFKEIVKQEDDIYIYKFINEDTQEECYVLWSPTQDGSKIDNYLLDIGNREKAQLTVLKDKSIDGEQFNLSVENGIVKVNVTESPIFVKVSGYKEDTLTKTLYTLPSVENMSLSGTNRGNWHDRQNLGIYMKSGASFEIRQINLGLNQDLTLDCLNNDSATEKSYNIPKNGEWVTVTVDNDSVPFIRTIFNTDEKPIIEIRNLQEIEKLTYYYYGDDEKEFFTKWKENNHSFAVIENDRATFLVPLKDRENIVQANGNKYTFKSIDEMLEYYHEFVEQFDKYIGLSYDTDNQLDKNVKTKFFVKANIHGAGAAYYGGNHTAQNGDSISGYLSRGWLNLHEFGHGYTGSLASQDLDLGEVMNNILAHYYQITFLGENDGGWLGKKLNIEVEMKNARETVSDFNELTYQQKLYVFVNLLDKIGPEKSMGYVHSKYREYLSQGIRYNASDMYSKSFSEISGFNVIPYLNSCKIIPSIDVETEIYEQELPMIYYLRDLVETDEMAEKIRKDLNLEGKYSLVSNDDIAKYKMHGNLNIEISIDDLEQIRGKKIYVKDGSEIVKEIVIEDKTIKIDNLPVGIYTLQIPNTKTESYEYTYQYVVIQENSNSNKEIEYKRVEMNALASDTQIIFKGLGDAVFATVSMDLKNRELIINSNNMEPHVYFTDEYANIQVLDKDHNVVYDKSYVGNIKSPSKDVIPMELGYTIKLKHREAETRLIFKSKILNENEEFKNLTNDQTSYVVTEYGLQKEGVTDEKQYKIYKEKVDKYIEKLKREIPEEKQKNKYCYFIQKNKLLSAIMKLNEEDRKQYLEDNIILINGSAPVIQNINQLEFIVGEDIQISLDNFKAIDLEDGEMKLVDENTKLIYDIPNEDGKVIMEGTYTAQIIAEDMDKNNNTKEFTIVVKQKPSDEQKPNDEPKPSDEQKPNDVQKPSDEQKPSDGQKPNNEQNNNSSKPNNVQWQSQGRLPQTGKTNSIIIVSMAIATALAIWQFIRIKRIK